MEKTRKTAADPPAVWAILKEVATRTKRPEDWLSVDDLDLDYEVDQIDEAIRVLQDRGWLSTSRTTPHSVSITVSGLKQVEDGASQKDRPRG